LRQLGEADVIASLVPKCEQNCLLDSCRRDAGDRSGLLLASLQQARADVEGVTDPVLDRIARTHPVTTVVIDQAGQKGACLLPSPSASFAVGLEKLLDRIEGGAVDDGLVLPRKPFAAVPGLAEVGAAFEQIGEGAIGERGAAGYASGDRPPFANDALRVEPVDDLLERLQCQISLEDQPDGLRLARIDDQAFVLGVVAERHAAAGP